LVKGYNLKNKGVRLSSVIDITLLKQQETILIEQSKMVAMGEMIGNIAHQWRQPLSMITSAASGMQVKIQYDIFDKDEALKDLDNLILSAQYLSTTIDDFQNFLKPTKSSEIFNIKDVVNKDLSMFEKSFIKNNIKFVLNLNDVETIGSTSQLLQVIINIVNNSNDILKISNLKERYIFIDLSSDENNAILKIKDNGNGIDKNNLPRVFDAYFTTKHTSQGTGLGLYMSYQIIKNSFNGNLSVINSDFKYNNKNYKGAEFTITLPLINKKEQ
jgi:signal transduction histidine kinase